MVQQVFYFLVQFWFFMLLNVCVMLVDKKGEVVLVWQFVCVVNCYCGWFNFVMWDIFCGNFVFWVEQALVGSGVMVYFCAGSFELCIVVCDIVWIFYMMYIGAVCKFVCWFDGEKIQLYVD